MALFLIIGGTLVGFFTGLVQCTLFGSSLMDGVITYFTFGLGVPMAIGLAKGVELRLRALFQGTTVMPFARVDG